MGIQAAYAVPHPPLIVPAVGKGAEQAIAKTIAAYEEVARRVAAHHPDTIIITSPHAPLLRDGFFISASKTESGSLAHFGCPQEALTISIDTAFVDEFDALLTRYGIPSTAQQPLSEPLDHATYVPLYFLNQTLDVSRLNWVRVGLSGLSSQKHRQLGKLLAQTAEKLNRHCILIASGDLSHKLKDDGPYGFAKEGPEFDQAIEEIFEHGVLSDLFAFDDDFCDRAAECGLRSFQIMAGALEESAFESELLSYEGPFGVGYGVAAFEVQNTAATSQEEAAMTEIYTGTDPLVALARETVERYITSRQQPRIPHDMPHEYKHHKAGVFVSLHEDGQLRGCIGTIQPQQHSIAEEVIANAISACTADPRFSPVKQNELDYLEYSVDVLGDSEPIKTLTELDPKRYGVIVSRGRRRGLLLPDLEGVETAEDQIAIARQKAGIQPGEEVHIERFEVIRHNAGGGARISE